MTGTTPQTSTGTSGAVFNDLASSTPESSTTLTASAGAYSVASNSFAISSSSPTNTVTAGNLSFGYGGTMPSVSSDYTVSPTISVERRHVAHLHHDGYQRERAGDLSHQLLRQRRRHWRHLRIRGRHDDGDCDGRDGNWQHRFDCLRRHPFSRLGVYHLAHAHSHYDAHLHHYRSQQQPRRHLSHYLLRQRMSAMRSLT